MIDRKEIDDMARILKVMDNLPDEPVNAIVEEAATVTRTPLSDPDIDAMRNILMRMNEAASEGPVVDVELKEALQTVPTPKGARIGSWEIVVHELSDDERAYDVVNVRTGEPIATKLGLYEAARGLVRRLNEGVSITDKRVRDLLSLEEQYVRNRNDASFFRQHSEKMREKGEEVKAAIAEDRFDDSQRKAIEAHDRILRLAGLKF
jgi:hypothetical protein